MDSGAHSSGEFRLVWDETAPRIQFILARGYAIHATREPTDSAHSPHAVKVMIPVTDALEMHVGRDIVSIEQGSSLLLAPDQMQHSASSGLRAAIFLDPETTGRGLKLSMGNAPYRVLGSAVTERLRAELTSFTRTPVQDDDGSLVERVYRSLAVDQAADSLDPRLLRVLPTIQASNSPPAISAIAALASLSPSRFAHLFTEQIGIPIGRYSRWTRLVRAVEQVTCGAQVTYAAVQTGFADAAHLSRTSRAMLGQRLSVLAAGRGHVLSTVYG